ncbi:MAG: cytochrome C oxidase subunit II [Spirochaetes bacterium RBG_16_67_19]|nr:MAG: cytochrome C oxidase subunit II [Spirochaetes bacterium RBG_16_67_19]
MASWDLPKSPNVFHPEKPSAVGSRNSLAQEFRDQQAEVDLLLSEEVDKVMNHISGKLPQDVAQRLDIMGGLKEKIYNYYNQNYQNMFNRYVVTTEDEMVKKVRNFIDKEEIKTLARYTPREVAHLLDAIGGMDKFNTGEIEKSIVNMYGHLHGHIQRGVNDLENLTNSLLRQKTDVGAFIRGQNAYSIVKCSFKDSIYKPKTVSDVKLSVNILDSELISPIFHYQVTVEYLIKDLISKNMMDLIDKEIDKLKETVIDEGREEMSDGEIMFERMKRVEKFTSDEKDDPKSKRYTFFAKSLMDRIEGLRAEIDPEEYDPVNIRENLKKIIDLENIRNRGFNTAINSITSILDTSKMGYQYVENLKNARELIIREYEDTDAAHLPDERYQIKMKYYDQSQLLEERKSFDVMAKSFEIEVQHLWDVLEMVYVDSKFMKGIVDFQDLAKRKRGKIRRRVKALTGDPLYEDLEKSWDEITFVHAGDTEVERMNRTYLPEKDRIKKMIILMRDKLQKQYSYKYPIQRRVMEERMAYLESEFTKFDYMINPYHIQPGLILDVDITSIKRKKATLDGMANVLNEFLFGVSKGFADAAFAAFSRRRSTVREDIAQSFGATPQSEEGAAAASGQFVEMLQQQGASEAKQAPARRGRGKGIVDVTPRGRGRPARGGRGRGRGSEGLKEI